MSLAALLSSTCTISTAAGASVATGVACRLQERIGGGFVALLAGMLGDGGAKPSPVFMFLPGANVNERDLISAVTHADGTTDSRRFVVLTVQSSAGSGGTVFKAAHCKVG